MTGEVVCDYLTRKPACVLPCNPVGITMSLTFSTYTYNRTVASEYYAYTQQTDRYGQAETYRAIKHVGISAALA